MGVSLAYNTNISLVSQSGKERKPFRETVLSISLYEELKMYFICVVRRQKGKGKVFLAADVVTSAL